VTKLLTGRLGFDSWQGRGFFRSPPRPGRLWGSVPAPRKLCRSQS